MKPATEPLAQDIEYPDSDGQPMAESDEARDTMIECIQTLERHFAGRPDVYVSGNLLLYYHKGDPTRSVAPDVLVVLGIPKRKRRIYQTWVEGKAPDVVIEISSETTWRRDAFFKTTLYANLGVREYFLFDTSRECLRGGPLLGLALDGPVFVDIEPSQEGRVRSEALGLELFVERAQDDEGLRLRFFDPQTGQTLQTPAEAAQAAELRAHQEAEHRQAAEQRAKELEDEIRRLRAERGR